MNLKNTHAFISGLFGTALLFAGFVPGAAAAPASASTASTLSVAALDDQTPALPLTASYDKVTDPDTGPNVLHLKNDSAKAITASASIQVSVPAHGSQKDRKISGHAIEAGDVWTITGLASGDKVTVTADGFSPLELTVP